MKFFTVLMVVLALFSCSSKDKKKDNKYPDHLGISPVEPPVEESMPDGLKTDESAGLTGLTECGPITDNPDDDACTDAQKLYTLKTRIFEGQAGCMGGSPANVKGRVLCALYEIDSRIAEIDQRSSETANQKRKCLDEPLQDFSMTIPGVGTFAQKYNCYDKLNGPEGFVGDMYLAFGIDDDTIYIREMQTQGNISLVKVTQSTGDVESVLISSKGISSTVQGDMTAGKTQGTAEHDGKYALSIMHFKANPTGKKFQFVTAANHSIGSGVGCGVQIRSSNTNVFAKGIFMEVPYETIEKNCATAAAETTNKRYLQTCLKASNLSVDSTTANCAAIDTFDLDKIYPADIHQSLFTTMIDTGFATTLTDFNESVAIE